MSMEKALLAQAQPKMLAAKAREIMREEITKGCRPEISLHPVALEPPVSRPDRQSPPARGPTPRIPHPPGLPRVFIPRCDRQDVYGGPDPPAGFPGQLPGTGLPGSHPSTQDPRTSSEIRYPTGIASTERRSINGNPHRLL